MGPNLTENAIEEVQPEPLVDVPIHSPRPAMAQELSAAAQRRKRKYRLCIIWSLVGVVVVAAGSATVAAAYSTDGRCK